MFRTHVGYGHGACVSNPRRIRPRRLAIQRQPSYRQRHYAPQKWSFMEQCYAEFLCITRRIGLLGFVVRRHTQVQGISGSCGYRRLEIHFYFEDLTNKNVFTIFGIVCVCVCFRFQLWKKLGMVGGHNILFCQNILYRNCIFNTFPPIFQQIWQHFAQNSQ